MERDAFLTTLANEGFPEPVAVTRDAGEMDVHTHPFEAKALITQGELHIRVGDKETQYRVGDVFHLAPNLPHSERYGAHGVQYLVGRKG